MTERKTGATLTLRIDGQGLALHWDAPEPQATLSATEIDALISALALYRAHLQPEVAPRLASTTGPFHPVPDPAYFIGPEALTGDVLMHLRHPGLGWLSFLLPRHEASRMAELLTRAATAPDPTPSPRQ